MMGSDAKKGGIWGGGLCLKWELKPSLTDPSSACSPSGNFLHICDQLGMKHIGLDQEHHIHMLSFASRYDTFISWKTHFRHLRQEIILCNFTLYKKMLLLSNDEHLILNSQQQQQICCKMCTVPNKSHGYAENIFLNRFCLFCCKSGSKHENCQISSEKSCFCFCFIF